MSSNLPRRVAQAALLVAAGAAPVVGATSAHAALPVGNLPLGGLPGIAQPDVAGLPLAAADGLGGAGGLGGILQPDLSELPSPNAEAAFDAVRPDFGKLPAVEADVAGSPVGQKVSRLTGADIPDTALPSLKQLDTAEPQLADLPLVGETLADVTQPSLSTPLPQLPELAPNVPQVQDMGAVQQVQDVAQQPDVADLVRPYVGKLADPEMVMPSVATEAVGKTGDAVGQSLEDTVVGPAMMGIGPALPVAGYATDQSVNAAMPATDAALAHGTQQHLVTNSADTVGGATTPLREVPYSL